jgi:MoxR-vWA-beta-propeller ternary system domain bpX4
MDLATFINTLLLEGKVTVSGQFLDLEQTDIVRAEQILLQYYEEDLQEMPGIAPEYSSEAALWAAQYFYSAVQLTVLRDAGEDVIKEKLKPFAGEIDSSTIYSADLIFRYLPNLFNLAKGLAPGDLLVKELMGIALAWPYSSVGIEIDERVNDDILFTNQSLKYAYLDRILKYKDKRRVINPTMENYITELTGEHISSLWPNFESVYK